MVVKENVARFFDGSPRDEPSWLADYREGAIQHFADIGFPSRKLEAWRFTDTAALAAVPAPGAAGTVDAATLAPHLHGAASHRLVFVNGRLDPALSDPGLLPEGAWVGSILEAVTARPDLVRAAFDPSDTAGGQAFTSLNGAFFADGFIVALADGVKLEKPVEVVYLSDAAEPAAFHLRNAIVAGPGAAGCVLETYAGAGAGWTNAVTKADLGDGAHVRHVRVQAEAPEAVHVATLRAVLASEARFDSFTLMVGARLSRQDVFVDLTGERAGLGLHGAYLLRGRQEMSFASFVEHHARDCATSEVLKGAIDEQAHGVFLGAVTVHPGADGTDARQLNRNLLLGPDARVDTKPELMIHADDVQCSHGATVGDLDEAALFYLAARGIEPDLARRMLVGAFVGDVIETAGLTGALADYAGKHIAAWLGSVE